ncbi:glycosyltransferase [Xanthobacter agilis]|uniref:glycosyltransferase n=1 Tax=Xanthobacter agilis TaxID=47492 RepID=UPI0037280AB3
MNPKISVSQLRWDSAASRFSMRGWIDPIDDISRIVFQVGPRKTNALLGTRRMDVKRAFPTLATPYCGFEAELQGPADGSPQLEFYGRDGSLIRRQRLKLGAEKVSNSTTADFRVVQRVLELQASRFTVLLRAPHELRADAMLQIGQAKPQLLLEISPSQSKILYPAGDKSIGRYYLASIAINVSADRDALATAPLRLHIGGEILELAHPTDVVTHIEFTSFVSDISFNQGNDIISVSGRTNSLAITSARIVIDDRMVAANRVFYNSVSKHVDDCFAFFSISALHPRRPDNDDAAIIEFLAGDEVVHSTRCTYRIGNTNDPASFVAPLPNNYSGVIYEFAASPERAALPWVAVFSGMPAWPSEGGGIARTTAIIRHLRANGYRVVLIAISANRPHTWVPKMEDQCDVLVLSSPELEKSKYAHIDVSSYRRISESALRILPSIDAQFAPHAFIINFAFNMYGAAGILAPVIVDTHDLQHLRATNARKYGGNLEDRRCTRAEERHLLSMANSILAITESEAVGLDALDTGRPVYLVPHAQQTYDTAPLKPEHLDKLFFVGQNYAPNVDGIRAFITEVWPQLISMRPSMELHVAGRVCEALSDLEMPGITLHGVAISLDPFYESCGIVLNPTPYGSGLKIKVVEGLARGRCVVATPEGRRGLPDDAPVITAPLNEFAAEILKLISAPDEAAAYAAAGKAFAIERFGADRTYGTLVKRLAELPARRRPTQGPVALVGYELFGLDLGLSFELPPSDTPIPMTLILAHGGRDLFRMTTAVKAPALGGIARVLMPFPFWLADGLQHAFDLRWEPGGQARIVASASRSEIDRAGPFVQPAWSAHVNTTEALWLVQPPIEVDQQATGPSDLQPRSFDIRHRGRSVGRAFGWVPEPQPPGAELLRHLDFSVELPPAAATRPLALCDRSTGLMAAIIAQGDLKIPKIADTQPRTLEPLTEFWLPEWPTHANIGCAVDFNDLAFIPGDNDGFIRPWIRFAAVIQATKDISTIELVFPPETDEDDVIRWAVFVDSEPAPISSELTVTPGAVISSHMVRIRSGDVARVELHGYPVAEALARPIHLKIG